MTHSKILTDAFRGYAFRSSLVVLTCLTICVYGIMVLHWSAMEFVIFSVPVLISSLTINNLDIGHCERVYFRNRDKFENEGTQK
jgi:UDP:flavonoid glycosyltransferase YjiC (YdhE family)